MCKYKPQRTSPWLKIIFCVTGVGSMIWLLLRSGPKPQRLAYPCQRIAAANSAGFLAYLAALLGLAVLWRRLKAVFSPTRLTFFMVGLLLTAILQDTVVTPPPPTLAASPDLPGWESSTAVSDVFVITNVPEPAYTLDGGEVDPSDDPDEALHDDGVDALINLMEMHGDYFYQTAAHSSGIFASDDVVVIKVNNQWDGRLGTNTDVVKGVIYRLVSHPEGFTGAVIVAENTQGANPDWYHQTTNNNSQYRDQSYQEVVQAFAGEGYPVCLSDWKVFRETVVNEFSAGDDNNGYVLEDADGSIEEEGHNRLSYPKFQINCNGTSLSVSMKNGIWNTNNSTYDNSHLKMINLPVLKRHNTSWATIAVKNYLGFMTTAETGTRWDDAPENHCWFLGLRQNGACTPYNETYGLIARLMGRIRRADLDIVDAVWVNPRDNSSSEEASVRQDVLLASRDPFAVDYYASDYILGPLIRDQYGDDSGYEQAMAGYRTVGDGPGVFRTFLMHNVSRLKSEGMNDTIDINDGMSQAQEETQFNVYVADAGTEFENIYIDPCGCTNTPCKGSITDAVDEISGPTALYIAGITFTENISLNSGVMITMKGGFNSGCSTDGPYTTITGNVPNTATLTIRDATLTVEDIILN